MADHSSRAGADAEIARAASALRSVLLLSATERIDRRAFAQVGRTERAAHFIRDAIRGQLSHLHGGAPPVRGGVPLWVHAEYTQAQAGMRSHGYSMSE